MLIIFVYYIIIKIGYFVIFSKIYYAIIANIRSLWYELVLYYIIGILGFLFLYINKLKSCIFLLKILIIIIKVFSIILISFSSIT